MDVGMLWLDDDKRVPLDDKIRRAADYYKEKYGRSPNLCMVNSAMLDDERNVGKIRVLPMRNVLPNHFWVGIKSG